MAIETYFLVAVNDDGTFTTYTELPAEPLIAAKKATNFDVYQSCKQIAQEFDSQILVDRITRAVVASLMPPKEPTTSDKIKDALKERGINPESKQPVQ
jgi:hypothetical protein